MLITLLIGGFLLFLVAEFRTRFPISWEKRVHAPYTFGDHLYLGIKSMINGLFWLDTNMNGKPFGGVRHYIVWWVFPHLPKTY